jgi:hypothetical protein
MAQNRECVVCGTKYQFCPHCNNSDAPSWKAIYDTENCKKIFDVCSAFVFKHIDAKEALNRLDKCDLSKEDKFAKGIKKDLADIRASVPVVVEEKLEDKVVSTLDIPVVETAEDDIEIKDAPKPKRRLRNRNKDVE